MNLIIKSKFMIIFKMRFLIIIILLFFLFLNSSDPVFADVVLDYRKLEVENQDIRKFNSKKYFSNFIKIPFEALGEIFWTDQAGLQRNILIGGVLLGSLNYLDQDIRDHVQDNIYVGDTNFSEFLYSVGDPKNILLIYIGNLIWSRIIDDNYLENISYYSIQSLLVTQVFTQLLKNIVNRDRPRFSKNDPFSNTGGESFVSGHAAGTWSIMTINAKRYPKSRYLSYSFASLVSVSRIYQDAHWFSDVLAGALLGYGVASLTLNLNDALPKDLYIEPLTSHGITGVAFSLKF